MDQISDTISFLGMFIGLSIGVTFLLTAIIIKYGFVRMIFIVLIAYAIYSYATSKPTVTNSSQLVNIERIV
jgi:hypothetical protein